MAAGGGAGVVTVWDLEARKLHTIIRDAHDAPVTKLHFFPGEPRLMSAGAVSTFHPALLLDPCADQLCSFYFALSAGQTCASPPQAAAFLDSQD